MEKRRKKGKGDQGQFGQTNQPGTSEEATTNASRFSSHQPRDGSEMMSTVAYLRRVHDRAQAEVMLVRRTKGQVASNNVSLF